MRSIPYGLFFSGVNALKAMLTATEYDPMFSASGEMLDLGDIYEGLIASAEKRELESMTMMQYEEKFHIFVALGIALIICEALISERKKTESNVSL